MSKNRAKKIKEISKKSRENLAKQTLDIEKILLKITALAEKGFQEYRIKPPYPVDLQSTDIANKVQQELAEMGFSVKWLEAIYPPEMDTIKNGELVKKKNETEAELNIREMFISWYSKSKMMQITSPSSSTKE